MIENSIYRCFSQNEKLLRWKSRPQNNFFSPAVDVPIWKTKISLELNENLLTVIKQHTDLYANNRWRHYNIFSWNDSSVKDLLKIIKNELNDFLEELKIEKEEAWINGWVFPQTQGMICKPHNHAYHENSYLSGNVILTENDISTMYEISILSVNEGNLQVPSVPGTMLLFPSYLIHWVPELKETNRYVIAFDIITNIGYSCFKENSNDPSDPIFRAVKL